MFAKYTYLTSYVYMQQNSYIFIHIRVILCLSSDRDRGPFNKRNYEVQLILRGILIDEPKITYHLIFLIFVI
jgi:hypothetical protein